MKEVEIPRTEWAEFVDAFTRQHRHWLTTIQFFDRDDDMRVLAEEAALEYVIFRGEAEFHVGVRTAGQSEDTVTHIVQQPQMVIFRQTDEGGHEGIAIRSHTGTTTNLEFRAAREPEELNGMV